MWQKCLYICQQPTLLYYRTDSPKLGSLRKIHNTEAHRRQTFTAWLIILWKIKWRYCGSGRKRVGNMILLVTLRNEAGKITPEFCSLIKGKLRRSSRKNLHIFGAEVVLVVLKKWSLMWLSKDKLLSLVWKHETTKRRPISHQINT